MPTFDVSILKNEYCFSLGIRLMLKIKSPTLLIEFKIFILQRSAFVRCISYRNDVKRKKEKKNESHLRNKVIAN